MLGKNLQCIPVAIRLNLQENAKFYIDKNSTMFEQIIESTVRKKKIQRKLEVVAKCWIKGLRERLNITLLNDKVLELVVNGQISL